MRRRDMIKLGAVAAGASVGVPGCAVPKLLSTLHGADGAAAWSAMLDEQLGKLDGPGLLHRMVEARRKQPLSAPQAARIAEQDAMFRRLLSTVLITQSFRELPEATQVEPAVQDRMWSHFDQIGSAVFEVSDMLAALDEPTRARVKTTLQDKPDLAMDLGEQLDARAARAGLSTGRRLQLRKMMAQTAFRLKNGHATSMIEEYVAKVDKLRTTDERHAAAIDLATKLGERAFWRRQQQMQAADPQSTPPAATPPTPAPPPAPRSAQEPIHVLLHRSARSAAKRGDCRGIAILAKRIEELDADYYRSTYLSDPLIASCREGVAIDDKGRLVDAKPAQVDLTYVAVKPPEHAGQKGLRTGAYMFGVGLGIGAGSALFLALPSDIAIIGVFGITAAVIMVGIGLLVLLISAIIYAAND